MIIAYKPPKKEIQPITFDPHIFWLFNIANKNDNSRAGVCMEEQMYGNTCEWGQGWREGEVYQKPKGRE